MDRSQRRLPASFMVILGLLVMILLACQPVPGQLLIGTPGTAEAFATVPIRVSTLTPAPSILTSSNDLDGTKVRFYHPWTGETGSVIGALVNEFNISNSYGIFVEITGFGGNSELEEKINDEFIMTGLFPNVVAAPVTQLHYWQTTGWPLIDLNPYLHNQAIGLSQGEIADFFTPFWQEGDSSGTRLGVPAYRTAKVLFYNQSWAQEMGFINPPTSMDDFMDQACTAAQYNASDEKRANDGTGGWIIDTSWQSAYTWLMAYEFTQFPADDSSSYVFAQPQVERSLESLRSFSDKGCAWVSRDPRPYEYFATRQALFYNGYLEEIPIQVSTNLRLKSADHWTVIPIPGVRNQKITLADGQDFAVFAATPREQLASWLFIKWLMQPKNQNKIVEASISYPLTYPGIASLNDLADRYPMWQEALDLIPGAHINPKPGSWVLIRPILADAFWKSLQANTPPDDMGILLRELDATIHEVLGQ